MKVLITQLPRWSYFMYYLLGFYELEKQNEIKFGFKKDILLKIASMCKSETISKGIRVLYRTIFKKTDLYNLKGYMILDNGEKKKFVIDSADSPYLFNSKDLEEADVYFKVQCPKNLDAKGFNLTPEILIPWTDHEKEKNGNRRKLCNNFEENRYKIRPLMLGPRKLSNGISYSLLKKAYENYVGSKNIKKDKKLMCYFGNSAGPIPVEVSKEDLDVDREAQIVNAYKNEIQHPNEKRAKAADIISEMKPKEIYDARVINRGNANSEGEKYEDKSLVIPIEDFCNHIAQFEYNLNISGYRLSIPNRFIESFISGTAIFTDKLSVKWYKPFDKEVVETVSMGYLKDEDVDWKKFKEDIKNLPKINKEEVLRAFNEKWTPIAVCKYMIEEILKA